MIELLTFSTMNREIILKILQIMMNTDSNGGGAHHPPKSPTQTNITVMTDAGPNPQSLEIRLNIGYFRTAPGILKLVELVSN